MDKHCLTFARVAENKYFIENVRDKYAKVLFCENGFI